MVQPTEVQSIVEEVVRRLMQQGGVNLMRPAQKPASAEATPGAPGVFDSMDDAIEAASAAFQQFRSHTLAQREKYVAVLRRVGLEHAEAWAKEEEKETKLGRWQHKVRKFDAVCHFTPGTEDLSTWAKTGDRGLTIEEQAPYGVIGAITPSTHPCATLICNGIGFIASGNTGAFNPHPGGKRIFAQAVATLNRELMAAGAPANLLTTVAEPTLETAEKLFHHGKTRVILVTGGPGVVKAALAAPKKAITAGPGNPPAVVDETADLDRAAKDIIAGASFDNNVLCIGEKEVFCVASVLDELKRRMVAHGCVELTRAQVDALAEKAFVRKGDEVIVNRDLVGRNASVLAAAIGLSGVSDDVPLLIAEVGFDHLFVQEEQMMPCLPLVRCKDVDEAMDMAVRAEHGYRHTFTMHSRNVEAMGRMARLCDASIFVKNGPSFAGLGYGGEGYCSYSIASPTGEGLTSARTFTRKRRCVLVDNFRII